MIKIKKRIVIKRLPLQHKRKNIYGTCVFCVYKYMGNTSLNWSHNGSKKYTVDSLSRNSCQRPLTNCHDAETARK